MMLAKEWSVVLSDNSDSEGELLNYIKCINRIS